MNKPQNSPVPIATASTQATTAPPNRSLWANAALVFGALASVVAVVSGIALGGIWMYNGVVERGRELEKTDQLARGLTELQSAKEKLATAHVQNQQIRGELERLLKDKETLRSERDSLRTQLDARQADVLQLTQMLAANDNCSFVHRQITAAQNAVDTHHAWNGTTPDYLRRHQILLDRLKEYQNQLGQCSGRATAAR
jgi:chromosome segregation ATPase